MDGQLMASTGGVVLTNVRTRRRPSSWADESNPAKQSRVEIREDDNNTAEIEAKAQKVDDRLEGEPKQAVASYAAAAGNARVEDGTPVMGLDDDFREERLVGRATYIGQGSKFMILQTNTGRRFFYKPKKQANISKWPKHSTITFKSTPDYTVFQGDNLQIAKNGQIASTAEVAKRLGLRVRGVVNNYRIVKGQLQAAIRLDGKTSYIDTVIWTISDNDTDGSEKPSKGDHVTLLLHCLMANNTSKFVLVPSNVLTDKRANQHLEKDLLMYTTS